jgi:hypothetical protein
MGYMHIDNLYRDDRIFRFKECYALEKIHGTSAHIAFKLIDGLPQITFFSGGEKHANFIALFVEGELYTKMVHYLTENHFLTDLKNIEVTIFGEAYGGKQQGMSHTYGTNLKFVVFDVRVDGTWLNVPDARWMAEALGLEFVDYVRIPTLLSVIDEERAKPSAQARRNGILEPKEREGIVLRPIEEARDTRGNRIITKHKNDSFKETKTQRQVDPDKLQVLADANKIADEWVTEMRLQHVLDKSGTDLDIKSTPIVIRAMIEDVKREASGEIVESQAAMKAISSATARLFKKWLNTRFEEAHRV